MIAAMLRRFPPFKFNKKVKPIDDIPTIAAIVRLSDSGMDSYDIAEKFSIYESDVIAILQHSKNRISLRKAELRS